MKMQLIRWGTAVKIHNVLEVVQNEPNNLGIKIL